MDTVLAFDVGTSGVKAVLLGDGRPIAGAVRSYGLETRGGGWVEQSLDGIRAGMAGATRDLLAMTGQPAARLDAIAVSAQMFNLAPVDERGDPVLPMLSWLDSRATERAERLAAEIDRDEQFRLTGSVLTAKDVLPKILWLRDERPDLYRRARWLLDCKEALVLWLTGRAVIDPSGASAFRLTDPACGAWSPEACSAFGVETAKLPEIKRATSIAGRLGTAAAGLGLVEGTPVIVGAGDVPATQVGSGAVARGDAHLSLGTAVYLGVTLDRPAPDPGRRLGVLGHAIPDRWILWLEIATGGGALAWLMRMLRGAGEDEPIDYAEVDRLVAETSDGDGLLFAPWLSGERVPVFDDRLRGAFVGLALHHRPAHLMRAVMEGVACQIRWAVGYAEAYGEPIGEIRAVGGGSIGGIWVQIIADILGRPVHAVADPQDAGARGVGACARAALGASPDLGFVKGEARIEAVFQPEPGRRAEAERTFSRYRRMYEALAPFYAAGAGLPQEAPPPRST